MPARPPLTPQDLARAPKTESCVKMVTSSASACRSHRSSGVSRASNRNGNRPQQDSKQPRAVEDPQRHLHRDSTTSSNPCRWTPRGAITPMTRNSSPRFAQSPRRRPGKLPLNFGPKVQPRPRSHRGGIARCSCADDESPACHAWCPKVISASFAGVDMAVPTPMGHSESTNPLQKPLRLAGSDRAARC